MFDFQGVCDGGFESKSFCFFPLSTSIVNSVLTSLLLRVLSDLVIFSYTLTRIREDRKGSLCMIRQDADGAWIYTYLRLRDLSNDHYHPEGSVPQKPTHHIIGG